MYHQRPFFIGDANPDLIFLSAKPKFIGRKLPELFHFGTVTVWRDSMDNNLPELRDIHLPQGVSLFPIAYGWWLVLALIILLILMIQFALYLRRYSKSRYAVKLLQNISTLNAVYAAEQMSEILRRICVFKYKDATTLLGKDWLDFLNKHAKDELKGRPAELLINAPYIPQDSKTYNTEDAEILRDYCKKWIGENL